MQKQKYRHLTPLVLVFFIFVLFISLSLSGCASYIKTVPSPAIKPQAVYKTRNQVLAGLDKNYGRFKGLSGRLEISARSGRFAFEQAGLYKYASGKYMQFTILDMYGDVLFYIKIFKAGNKAIFLDRRLGKIQFIDFNKKYTGKILMYERLFKVFKILLDMNNLEKIKKAGLFYNTSKGFFFGYRPHLGKAADEYYIYVSKNYLIRKITEVTHRKITEIIRFKDYVLKGGSMVPLKMHIDDYLYNVKIKVALSKGSKIIQ